MERKDGSLHARPARGKGKGPVQKGILVSNRPRPCPPPHTTTAHSLPSNPAPGGTLKSILSSSSSSQSWLPPRPLPDKPGAKPLRDVCRRFDGSRPFFTSLKTERRHFWVIRPLHCLLGACACACVCVYICVCLVVWRGCQLKPQAARKIQSSLLNCPLSFSLLR